MIEFPVASEVGKSSPYKYRGLDNLYNPGCPEVCKALQPHLLNLADRLTTALLNNLLYNHKLEGDI